MGIGQVGWKRTHHMDVSLTLKILMLITFLFCLIYRVTLFYPSFFGRFNQRGYETSECTKTLIFHVNPINMQQLGILCK